MSTINFSVENIIFNECKYNRLSDIKAPSPIQTVDEGVTLAEEIFQKRVLCPHDVEEINYLYKECDRLEGNSSFIPEQNSHKILQTALNKMKQITEKTTSGKDMLSCYYLQNFKGFEELPIANHLKEKFSQYTKNPETIKKIAKHLPCCTSKEEFKKDVAALIGSGSKEIIHIIAQKEQKVQIREDLRETIKQEKIKLATNRLENPTKYPLYLEELLNGGYIHLYQHLSKMREPSTNPSELIQKISFSELCHIVLETRDAIIKKVTSNVPQYYRNIFFLFGRPGSGKSTTLCYLRGDTMIQTENDTYESANDNDALIGRGTISCTFLPIIERIGSKVVIDFPGYNDTNGSLISLGIEFALKELIHIYNPKILVLEAITNNEGRGQAATELGNRLHRLLGAENKQKCILGLTKYIQYNFFIKLQKLQEEEHQQKKALLEPTKEESHLQGIINYLTEVNDPSSQPDIEKKKKELQILQEKRQKASIELPETEQKKKYRKCIEDIENEWLQLTGLNQYIRFSTLTNPQSIWNTLSKAKSIESKQIPNTLDDYDDQLLTKRFEEDLKIKIAEGKYNTTLENLEIRTLERTILETSFINAIVSDLNPEIGRFLSLLDPNIVFNFDQKIIEKCIETLILQILSNINIDIDNKIIEEFGSKISSEEKRKFQSKQKKIQRSIAILEGYPVNNEEAINNAWKNIQEKYKKKLERSKDSYNESFASTPWSKIVNITDHHLINSAYYLITDKQQHVNQVIKKNDVAYFGGYYIYLDETYDTLVRLKGIKKTIENKKTINEAIQSFSISLESFNDLKKSIEENTNRVRKIYGEENWDIRVKSLVKIINLSPLPYKELLYILSSLYFSQYPEITIININADQIKARKLLNSEVDVAKDNALLFQKKDLTTVVLQRKTRSLFERSKHPDFFKDNNGTIEIIDSLGPRYRTILQLKESGEDIIFLKLEKLMKILKLGNDPISQILCRAAINKSKHLKKDYFLIPELKELPIRSIQTIHKTIQNLVLGNAKANEICRS